MEKPLRIAVIGAGRMGRHHARIYGQDAGCVLAAVVDKDISRARAVAGEFGGVAAAGWTDIRGEIDAASVAVPTVYHAEVAIPLMENGVAVLVEKPLAPDAGSARQLLEASRRTGRLLQVGHSERFNPVVQALLRMEVTPRFIETQRVSPFTFRSADIGVVFDMMIHDIDIVLHLVRAHVGGRGRSGAEKPSVKGVSESPYWSTCTIDAVGVGVLGQCEDVANARVWFGDAAAANLTASRLALKTERRIRVFCPTAYLSMDYHKKSGIAIKLADNVDLLRMAKDRNFEDLSQMQDLDFGSMVKIEPLVVDDVEPLKAEIGTFLDSVRNGTEAAVSAEDGYAAVELAERITNAVREKNWNQVIGK
jgi:predicted dehydrogenase